MMFQQFLDLRDYLGCFFPRACGPRRVCVPAPTPLPAPVTLFVRGPRCAHPVAATRPIADRPRGPTSATPGRHTNGAGARPAGWRTAPGTPLTPPRRPRRKRSQGFPRALVVPVLGAGGKPHPGNSTETARRLAGGQCGAARPTAAGHLSLRRGGPAAIHKRSSLGERRGPGLPRSRPDCPSERTISPERTTGPGGQTGGSRRGCSSGRDGSNWSDRRVLSTCETPWCRRWSQGLFQLRQGGDCLPA